jgi:hypothetical protein
MLMSMGGSGANRFILFIRPLFQPLAVGSSHGLTLITELITFTISSLCFNSIEGRASRVYVDRLHSVEICSPARPCSHIAIVRRSNSCSVEPGDHGYHGTEVPDAPVALEKVKGWSLARIGYIERGCGLSTWVAFDEQPESNTANHS